MTRHFFLRKFVKKINVDGIFSTQIREKMNRNDIKKKNEPLRHFLNVSGPIQKSRIL
jgi:FAD synthase